MVLENRHIQLYLCIKLGTSGQICPLTNKLNIRIIKINIRAIFKPYRTNQYIRVLPALIFKSMLPASAFCISPMNFNINHHLLYLPAAPEILLFLSYLYYLLLSSVSYGHTTLYINLVLTKIHLTPNQ